MALSERQQQMIAEAQSGSPALSPRQREMISAAQPEKQRFRTAMQGFTFGFGDEIEAYARSLISEDKSYSEIRDELRGKIAAYQEAHPGEAITYEILGAAAPTVAAFLIPGGQGAGAANVARFAPTAGKIAATSAGMGGVAGLGYGESESVTGMAAETAAGAATGLALGGTLHYAGKGAGKIAGGLYDFIRTKLKDKPANAVIGELQRIMAETGKNADEIAQDIAEGRLWADNKTLVHTIKNYVNQGGESGKLALSNATARAKETKQNALKALRGSLAPNQSDNVYASMKQSDDVLRNMIGSEYNRVFESGQTVSDDLAGAMLEYGQRMPSLLSKLNKLHSESGLAPLFSRGDDGVLAMTRRPTVQDAELMYRSARDFTDALYKSSNGSRAGNYKSAAETLKNLVDIESKDLANVRASAEKRFSTKAAYEDARKRSLNMSQDELAYTFNRMSPHEQSAYRIGVMDSLQNNKAKNTLLSVADADHRIGQNVRTVLPADSAAETLRMADIAGEAYEIARMAPKTAGSPTAGLTAEAKRQGGKINLDDIGRMGGMDATVIPVIAKKLFSSGESVLTDQQKVQVIETIYSRSPELVKKALNDDTALAQLGYLINRMTGGLIDGSTGVGSRVLAGEVSPQAGVITDRLIEAQ